MIALRLFVVALFCFLLCSAPVRTQDVRASAHVDSNNIMIGDWLGLYIEVQHREHVNVAWPQLADSLEGFEIVQRGTIETKKSGSDVLETLTFIITSFDSGTFVIPPLQFLYSLTGDSVKQIAETSPIPVFVHTVAVDTSQDIKDVKPPMSLPITFAELLPYIIALGIALAVGWLGYYIWKRRRRGESIIPQAPPRPAHEVALDALRSLEAEKLWQRGKLKEYYSSLTDILRTYIEGRFGVMAMEMVTDEIISAHQISALQKELRDPLHTLLTLSDFVKFAKLQPTLHENESSITVAVRFVESTWRPTEHANIQQPAEQVS